ncbi:glycosyltransferase [Shimia ponticola]|uniref:glycosyltransferase n=1 Tax=Shimia ponticola TaxID=2582893 RepID=UPI0011BF61B7|nr:glycosyltransferase [Shimia ponticola]
MGATGLRLVAGEPTIGGALSTPPIEPAHASRDALDVLISWGRVTADDALDARLRARRVGADLDHVLIQRNVATEALVAAAQADVENVSLADLVQTPPDPRLIDILGAQRAIQLGIVPWQRAGKAVLVAAPTRRAFQRALPELRRRFGQVLLVIAPRSQIVTSIAQVRKMRLTRKAETLVPALQSCRSLSLPNWQAVTIVFAAVTLSLCLIAPGVAFAILTGIALTTLVASMLLKAAAVLSELRHPTARPPAITDVPLARLPQISVMVPLYKEREIAGHLVERLRSLNYPRERLEVILVTESDDQTTRDTLNRTQLPSWMRVVTVPDGTVKTKPRAMNYALDHCQGTIIGVYDAEDAPEHDQLLKVAAQFAKAPPEVVCLQGALDFYNPTENWLSRCFAMEYAAWFRVILPGLATMALAIPLGGTTLFFRRDALIRMRGWDAHNVTEDADLGIRLARMGYRTALLPSTTFEEANNRPWAWIKQRSRWLKGYGITYAVHMRNPKGLWVDLGAWRFLGFQVLFLGTITQFLLAPVLWTYWLLIFGLPHPTADLISANGAIMLTGLFILSELINIACVGLGVARTRHRRMMPWIPTLMAYFPLATVAIYKGFSEFFGSPFYWDKTSHGKSRTVKQAIPPPHPDAAGS